MDLDAVQFDDYVSLRDKSGPSVVEEKPSPTELFRLLFLGDEPQTSCSAFFSKNVCGVQELCTEFEIEPSMVTYRALMAAILQLGLFTGPAAYGDHTLTAMIRPEHHLDCVVGATLITESRPDSEFVERFCALLEADSEDLLGREGAPPQIVKAVQGVRRLTEVKLQDAPVIPSFVLDRLTGDVLGGRADKDEWTGTRTEVKSRIELFRTWLRASVRKRARVGLSSLVCC